jgi:hypothetical protein
VKFENALDSRGNSLGSNQDVTGAGATKASVFKMADVINEHADAETLTSQNAPDHGVLRHMGGVTTFRGPW